MKIAFVGFEHIHIFDVYDKVKKNSEYEIVGTFLSDYELAHQDCRNGEWVKKRNIERTHNSYEEMLAESGADIIAVGTSFAQRGDVIIKALRAGKHVITDKPVCTKLSELEEIAKLPDLPTVVTGDFNCTDGASTYKKITGASFVDVSQKAKNTTDKNSATFHNYGRNLFDRKPIDFIFVTEDVKVSRYKIIDEQIAGMFLSDHYGLCADITI